MLIILCTMLIIVHTTPICASEKLNILVSIKNDANRYIVEISKKNIKIKTISNKLYTTIPCLNDEKEKLERIDFSPINDCLINSLENTLHINIDNYVNVDMKTLLKAIDLPANSYDYKTLHSLTKVSNKIINRLNLSLLMNYQDYINTDLGFKELYTIYKSIKKKHSKITYYDLKYFIFDDSYILFDTTFHKKSK